MADPTLADILMRPVMPEEYDRPSQLGSMQPYAEAFGAGLVDPMGVPSWVYNKLAGSPNSDWYKRWMQEKRDQSPVAAGMGSAVPLAVGGMGVAGLRAAAQFPGYVTPGMIARDTGRMLGPAMAMGGALGNASDLLSPSLRRTRPQAAYPPGGAY